MEAIFPRAYYLRWTCGAICKLLTESFEARNMKKCVCSCSGMCTRYMTPLVYTPVFVIFVIILQSSMLGLISVRIYIDNFKAETNITRNGTEYIEVTIPEDGTYHVNLYTWYTIIGGIVVPLLSIVTYFIINQYWLWQALHYTGKQDSSFVPKNTMIGSMSNQDKWFIFAFDPLAWVSMGLLLSSFIAFCVFASGIDYDGTGSLPNWVNGMYLFGYMIMCSSFLGANTQTVMYGCLIFMQPCFLFVVLVQIFRRPQYRLY